MHLKNLQIYHLHYTLMAVKTKLLVYINLYGFKDFKIFKIYVQIF